MHNNKSVRPNLTLKVIKNVYNFVLLSYIFRGMGLMAYLSFLLLIGMLCLKLILSILNMCMFNRTFRLQIHQSLKCYFFYIYGRDSWSLLWRFTYFDGLSCKVVDFDDDVNIDKRFLRPSLCNGTSKWL